MLKRYAIASSAVVGLVVAVILFDGLVAALTGFALPGEFSAAIAFFIAFFVGARIGGSQYFWAGVLLFLAIQAWSSYEVFDAIRDIESSATGDSAVTWVSVFAGSWSTRAFSLIATIAGLLLGRRDVSLRNPQNLDAAK